MVNSKNCGKICTKTTKEVCIMAKTNEKENIDTLIKGAFDTLVKNISRKLKRKEPSEKETRDYVLEKYAKLQNQLAELEVIANSPKSYFRQTFESKYTIAAGLSDISAYTLYSGGEKLQSLILLVAEYYAEEPKNQKALEPALKSLIKKIETNPVKSMKRGIAKIFSLAQSKKTPGREK